MRPAVEDGAPIFLLGCPRSGTSLLSRLIGSHPRIAVPFESHIYNTFRPLLPRYGDLDKKTCRHRLVDDILRTQVMRDWSPRPDRRLVLESITRHDFHGVFEGFMRAWMVQTGKQRWGEKTPQHLHYWRELSEGFPDMRVIHIVRDGRDVALSWRRARFGPKHVYPLAQRWVRYLDTMQELRRSLPPGAVLRVYYEELVAQPEKSLRTICAFLGEDYAPRMLDFHREATAYKTDAHNLANLRRPIATDNVGNWKKQMRPRDLRIFEAVAAPTLARFGYEPKLEHATISRRERLQFRLLEHPPRRCWAMVRNVKGYADALRRLAILVRLRLMPPLALYGLSALLNLADRF